MVTSAVLRSVDEAGDVEGDILDHVFFALSDPVRRAILERLDEGPLLVSELAAPFAISLQAVSRHIQVLVRAGLIAQERTGRVSRCSLDAQPVYNAALWINRYSKYWQDQFNVLAVALQDIDARQAATPRAAPGRTKRKPRSSTNRRH